MRASRPWLIAIAVVVVGVIIRIAVGGYGALDRAETAQAAGEPRVAALEYRQALAWYLPIAPWRAPAADALLEMAKTAQSEGDDEETVLYLNMRRSGILAGRSLFGVDDEALAQGDKLLAAALARWEAKAALEETRPSPGPLAAREKHYAEVLANDPMPSRGWGLIAVLGFFAWIGGAAAAAGVQAGRRRTISWAVSVVGLVGFLAGVGLA